MFGWFANLRYSHKMLLAFGLIIATGLLPFVFGLRSLYAMRDALHATHAEGQEISALYQAQTDSLKLHLAENAFILSRAPADLETSQELVASVVRSLEELAEVAESADEVEAARGLQKAIAANHQAFLKMVARSAEGSLDPVAAAELVEQQAIVAKELRELVDDAREDIEHALSEVGQAADDDAQSTMLFGVGLAGACMALGVIMSVVLARQITRPITELRTVAEKISLGETDVTVTTGRTDEIGQLAAAFDRMVTAVRFLAMEVAEHEQAQQQRDKES